MQKTDRVLQEAFVYVARLPKVYALYDSLSSPLCNHLELGAFSEAFEQTMGPTPPALLKALHDSLLGIVHNNADHLSSVNAPWVESPHPHSDHSSRAMSTSDTRSPHCDPLRAFCYGVTAFSQGTMEEKFHVGFEICSKRKPLDLHAMLAALKVSCLCDCPLSQRATRFALVLLGTTFREYNEHKCKSA